MGFKDTREWIGKLEADGELKRIKASVDWNGELSEIAKRVMIQQGPALLFENIKGYENARCRRLFTGGLGSWSRMAMMLGLPKDVSRDEMLQLTRKRFKESIEPVRVKTGPVKENIVKGDKVNLFEFPVPKWHPLDGGRYINTFCGVVTRDPETGELNMGVYRGMVSGRNKIGILLVPAQHWGIHYLKYKGMGKPMPVAVVHSWHPAMEFVASASHHVSEYGVLGAIRQEPVELVKCETSDLEVPASAEIVIEGSISPDPATYEMEGPFGEWSGYYGEARKRPVIKVDCITHRDDPILRGLRQGPEIGVMSESAFMGIFKNTALMWNVLESQGVPGVLDIVPGPVAVVKIRKTDRGQARRVAAALWGSQLSVNVLKVVMVVEEDVDIHNLRALERAFLNYVDPKEDLVIFPGTSGSSLDPSQSYEDKDELLYGAGKINRLLIDATINWETHPPREEWGNARYPPTSTESLPEVAELVQKRWKEYGI